MSGLDFQVVDVKFTQGLDTKTQAKLVIPGKWNQLNNISIADDNTPKRRDGVTALVATRNGNSLATYNNELLAISGPSAFTISNVGTPAATSVPGVVGNVFVSKSEICRTSSMQDSVDCATSGTGWTCYAWRDLNVLGNATGISVTLVDEATGSHVIPPTQINTTAAASSVSPRVVYSGGAFFVLYGDTATTVIRCRVIDLTAPTTIGADTLLVTDANIDINRFDAIEFGVTITFTSSALVVYSVVGASADSVRMVQVIRAGTTPSINVGPVSVYTAAQIAHGSIAGLTAVAINAIFAGVYVVTTGAGPGINGAVVTNAFALSTASTNLDGFTCTNTSGHIVGCLVNGNTQLFADDQSGYAATSSGLGNIRTVTVSQALAVVIAGSNFTPAALFRINAAEASGPQGPFIHGKPFTTNTTPYTVFLPTCIMENWGTVGVNTATQSTQSTLLLFNCSTAQVVAKALCGTYAPPAIQGSNPHVATPTSSPALSSGVYAVPAYERSRLVLVNGQNVSPSGVCRISFTINTTLPHSRIQLGGATFIAGGNIVTYDGLNIVEHGFTLAPEGISVTTAAGAGSITAGVHDVVAVYEWVDNAGQRNQSAPSIPVAITAGAANTDTFTVRVPTLLVSQKSGVTIALYMTLAGGVTFFRVGTFATATSNTTAAAIVSPTISSADTTISSNEILYATVAGFTGGTASANISPGPAAALCVHQNRLFYSRADSPNEWGYSQPLATGTGLQFNELLGGLVDVKSGGIVGMETMDEKLIFFCTNRPYVLFGNGADANGQFSTYGTPSEIPADVGCVDAKSIIRMPRGIIFKSQKGWYQMGRDLVCRYIGEGVNDYDANAVTAAVLMADRQETRFASSSGTQLIYNYEVRDGMETLNPVADGQWTTSTMSAHDYLVSDAVYWSAIGAYVTLSLTDGLNKDTPGVYLDSPGAVAQRAIVTTLRTSFLHPGALESFQRVRRIYLTGTAPNSVAAVTSTVNIAVDYDDAYGGVAPGAYNFSTALGTIAFGASMPIDLRAKLRRQKCKSVAFTFTDTPTTSIPAGVNWQALALEVGLKRGPNRLPAAQSVG